jgi:hypothetical protein
VRSVSAAVAEEDGATEQRRGDTRIEEDGVEPMTKLEQIGGGACLIDA